MAPTLERTLSFNSWHPPPAEEDSTCRSSSTRNDLRPQRLSLDGLGKETMMMVMLESDEGRRAAAAATKLQKCYRSYRTRRKVADCAVLVEELWWRALDFASLKQSSVSFFHVDRHEPAASRWARAGKRVAKVGKGLSKDDKARKLALQHWLEAIDPRHRYGHNLHLYYDVWFANDSTQPFFYWLDVGDGREVNLDRCPRARLQSQLIHYLGPKERAAYEVVVAEGKLLYKKSGAAVHTTDGSKWIFVLSTARSLYVAQKKKGEFQHSSFLAGGATTAAGRLVAKDGILKAIWPYSGHYLPTEENFKEFISFLEDNKVNMSNVKRCSVDDDEFPSMKKKEDVGMAGEAASRLPCKWSTGTGARIGCVRDYPLELQSQALEHVNLSQRNAASPKANMLLPIPSPRPSPKVRLSPRLQYMGLPSPSAALRVA